MIWPVPCEQTFWELTVVGQVLFGINNIYTVQVDACRMQCRIKGKVLKTEGRVYNPIAVGDQVELEQDPISNEYGWIQRRLERKSSLIRWNKKKKAIQIMAANADLLFCILSTDSPPFRPRFGDRMLISAEFGGMEPVLVLNKIDLGLNDAIRERLDAYREAGYRVILCSALSGEGIEALRASLEERVGIFAGQSGVGKSSILNRIDPDLELKVGDISSKYKRGVHTTTHAALYRRESGLAVIDTPGIREFELAGIKSDELYHYFPELARHAPGCGYAPCLHLDEPDCAVIEALEAGMIHPDRYESYLRLYEQLNTLEQEFHGSPYDQTSGV